MADSQNTVAGTQNGGQIFNANGNPFLQAIANLSNVATSGLDAVTSFKERLAIYNATSSKPKQTVPSFQVTDLADWFSNPKNVQNAILWSILAIGGTIAAIRLARKI